MICLTSYFLLPIYKSNNFLNKDFLVYGFLDLRTYFPFLWKTLSPFFVVKSFLPLWVLDLLPFLYPPLLQVLLIIDFYLIYNSYKHFILSSLNILLFGLIFNFLVLFRITITISPIIHSSLESSSKSSRKFFISC